MKKPPILLTAALMLAVLAAGAFQYQRANLETMELDGRLRGKAPGAFVSLTGGITHYQLEGPESARTAVLIPGFSVPYYLWDPTFAALRKAGYRVLRYDLFGRGYSERPWATYDGDLFDRQLLDLLEALNIRGRVDLIGASMGGPIASGFACQHLDRVRSITMIGPGYSTGGQLPWYLRWPVVGEYYFATSVAPTLAESQTRDFLHPEKFPDWAGRYRPQTHVQGFRHALLSTLRNYVDTDWSRKYTCVGKSELPVLLVWGKHDEDVPFAVSEKVRALIPQAEFLPVEEAGHIPFMETPAAVEPALIRFLAAAGK